MQHIPIQFHGSLLADKPYAMYHYSWSVQGRMFFTALYREDIPTVKEGKEYLLGSMHEALALGNMMLKWYGMEMVVCDDIHEGS